MPRTTPIQVITLTGPSCSGKSVLARALVASGVYKEAISTTTRPPRSGEVDGKHYNFVTKEQYAEIERAGRLVESLTFSGEYYGVTADEFEKAHAQGKVSVLVCEPVGVEQINHYSSQHGWLMGAVYFGVSKSVAVERFYERFKSEQGADGSLDRYAKRMVKVLTDERDWQDVWDYDAYLPHSMSQRDTNQQVGLVNQAMLGAIVPEKQNLRVVRHYQKDMLDRVLTKITVQMASQREKDAIVSDLSELTFS